MIRSTLSVIAGFVLWSVLWLGYNALLTNAGILISDNASPVRELLPLLLLLVGSFLFSLASGYLTSLLAKMSGSAPALVLGLLLLAVGILVQTQLWQIMPLWYHLLFLLLLLPATLFGARLRTS